MKVKVMVKRYNGYEMRTIDIDIESVIAQELSDLAGSCAGFEDEPEFSVDCILAKSISEYSLE